MTAPLANKPETVMVDRDTDDVKCDGGGGPLGHPLVWYSFDGSESVTCTYCGCVFLKKQAGKA